MASRGILGVDAIERDTQLYRAVPRGLKMMLSDALAERLAAIVPPGFASLRTRA